MYTLMWPGRIDPSVIFSYAGRLRDNKELTIRTRERDVFTGSVKEAEIKIPANAVITLVADYIRKELDGKIEEMSDQDILGLAD